MDTDNDISFGKCQDLPCDAHMPWLKHRKSIMYEKVNQVAFIGQPSRLRVVTGLCMKIGADAVLQINRLAYIADRPSGVFHDVTAGLCGKRGKDSLQFL